VPRTFTAVDARSDDPDRLRAAFETWASDRDAAWEPGDPAGDEPGRLRWDADGTHHAALGDALTDGTLAPHDWAVVTWTMDEAVGVNAWVYEAGAEVDAYEGVEGWQGADTEAYLERFHGVRVDRAGPYATSRPYRPSVHLATLDPPTTRRRRRSRSPTTRRGSSSRASSTTRRRSPAGSASACAVRGSGSWRRSTGSTGRGPTGRRT
jgi:hypothetical protein